MDFADINACPGAVISYSDVVVLTFADQSGQLITLSFDEDVLRTKAPALLEHHNRLLAEVQISWPLQAENDIQIPGFEIAAAQLLHRMLHHRLTNARRPDKVILICLANAAFHYGCTSSIERWFEAWRHHPNLYNGNEHVIVLAAMSRISETLHVAVLRELLMGSSPSEVRMWSDTAKELVQQMHLSPSTEIHTHIADSIQKSCDNFSKLRVKLCDMLEKMNDKLMKFEPSKAGTLTTCMERCVLEAYLSGLFSMWSRKHALHRADLISKKQLGSVIQKYKKLSLPDTFTKRCNKRCPGIKWTILVREFKDFVAALLQEFDQKLTALLVNSEEQDNEVEMLDDMEFIVKREPDVEVIVIDD